MNEFRVTIRETEKAQVFDLLGYLDAHTAPILEEAFQKMIGSGKFRIIINCRDLTYISSAGLGVFMAYIEDVRANQGDIKMSNMSPKVFNIFDLLGFPMLYDIVNDESDAIAKFSALS
jgi:anti-sigma B factor antagonist